MDRYKVFLAIMLLSVSVGISTTYITDTSIDTDEIIGGVMFTGDINLLGNIIKDVSTITGGGNPIQFNDSLELNGNNVTDVGVARASELFSNYSSVNGNLNVTGNITSQSFINGKSYAAQFYRENIINTGTINTWENVTWNKEVISIGTDSFSLSNSNQSITAGRGGIYRVAGSVHPYSNSSSSKTMEISTRVTVNGVEKKGTQASSYKQRQAGAFNHLNFNGVMRLQEGDNISLQYQVDDTDLDIKAPPTFDDPTPIEIHLIKISN